VFVRRSRGYAPEPIGLGSEGPEVMGCGADLKNTFTITKGEFAIPSQHIGDMENYETLQFFEESLENLRLTYRANPVALAHDLHPGYLSTLWTLGRKDMPEVAFQHHYAHIGSVMAEHGLRTKVLGVAFDGTGYGTDGNLWGGEFLIAGIEGFDRAARFKYIPLPGGEMAIKEPWRTGVSYIMDAAGEKAVDLLEATGFIARYGRERTETLMKVREIGELSPLSSGAGRLFDAVSALIGLCDHNTFEGEAAIAMESLVSTGIDEEYPFELTGGMPLLIDFSPTINGIIGDLLKGRDKRLISTKFHNTLSGVILGVTRKVREVFGLDEILLSGGTFQNMYLLRKTMKRLASEGFNVFINKKVPCNDACISLGQAYLLRERIKEGMHPGSGQGEGL
jgi:hydrogenase maturation protein HypF